MSSHADFEALASARYVLMTTFRRDGRPVPTPLGPLGRDGKLYFYTRSDSGKLKRIRHTRRVQLAPCDMRGRVTGAISTGQARILEGTEAAEIAEAFRQHWGWRWYHMRLVDGLRRKTRTVIEVEPAGPSIEPPSATSS